MKNQNKVHILAIPQQRPASSFNFMDGLALLLIGLKLTDHLQTWTWIEVLAPVWAPLMINWFLHLVQNTFSRNKDLDSEE